VSEKYLAPGAVEYDRLDDLSDEKKYILRLFCSECHTMVNESRTALTKKELQKRWAMIVMSSGLVTGPCPKCKATTFSDLNIHTDLCIFEEPAPSREKGAQE